jgi:transcriptional antiterminator RfaH
MGTQPDRLEAREAPWIVVNTQAHREHIALENLYRQEFDAYCPMIRRRRSHARRVSTVLRALFPGYLFVRADRHLARWRPILSTYGVRAIVRAGKELSFIDDAFITSLKAREVDGAIVRPPNPYRIGQRVQILTGPFDGLVATIIEMDEKDRLVVLLDLMNRGIRTKLKSERVNPCPADA